MWVYVCTCVFVFDREAERESFCIYECVRQHYKSCTGLLRRGEPHQKWHSSAICYWLKLCNCNSVASVHTTRSMQNKFTHRQHSCTHANTHRHMQTLQGQGQMWDVRKKEYLALRGIWGLVSPGKGIFIYLFILVTSAEDQDFVPFKLPGLSCQLGLFKCSKYNTFLLTCSQQGQGTIHWRIIFYLDYKLHLSC